MEMHIDEIEYSQDSIGDRFSDGTPLTELCEDILEGTVSVYSLSRICVAERDGEWFAMDGNRRLFVLKKLYARGKIDGMVPVKLGYIGKPITAIPGVDIEVRGDLDLEDELDALIDGSM